MLANKRENHDGRSVTKAFSSEAESQGKLHLPPRIGGIRSPEEVGTYDPHGTEIIDVVEGVEGIHPDFQAPLLALALPQKKAS